MFVFLNSAFSPSYFIKLAYGVSKAAAHPSGDLVNSNGQIVYEFNSSTSMYKTQRLLCVEDGWKALKRERIFRGTSDNETAVLVYHPQKKLAVIGFHVTNEFALDYRLQRHFMEFYKYINTEKFGIHTWFYTLFYWIKEWYRRYFKRLVHLGFKIILTGHGIGGALAQAAAVLYKPPDAVITFGAPKVGNSAFKRYYERVVGCNNTIKVEADCDITIKLPNFSQYVGVCSAVSIKSACNSLQCNRMEYYFTGLQAKYGEYLQDVNQGCDQ